MSVSNGDKVRLTIEGIVQDKVDDKNFTVQTAVDPGWRVFGSADYKLEVLEPAGRTFRPGTLVSLTGGLAVRATAKDRWTWVETGGFSGVLDDKYVDELLSNPKRKGDLLYEPSA